MFGRPKIFCQVCWVSRLGGLAAMICLDFLPRKVGGSIIMTLNLTCMFQPINKIHPGRVSGFQTHRRVKGIHPQTYVWCRQKWSLSSGHVWCSHWQLNRNDCCCCTSMGNRINFLQNSKKIWVFPKIEVPQNGWFIMENLFKMDDLGDTPIFGNTYMSE